MLIVKILSLFIIYVILVILASFEVIKDEITKFELDRKIKKSDKNAQTIKLRSQFNSDILAWQNILVSLFLVLFVLFSVSFFGWLIGTVIAVFGAIEFSAISRLKKIKKQSAKIYEKIEHRLLEFAEKYGKYLKFLRGTVEPMSFRDTEVKSREELEHVLNKLGKIVTTEEKKILNRAIKMSDKKVLDIMTPRSVVDYVESDEMLGPLKIDELYKTGHSRFPVIGKNVDDIIGILYLRDLVVLEDKKTKKANQMTKTPVYFVSQEESIDKTLIAFLKHQTHLFVVINEYRETVGVVSVEDAVEFILDRKIVDEDDVADDLRKLAADNSRKNNSAPKSKDV